MIKIYSKLVLVLATFLVSGCVHPPKNIAVEQQPVLKDDEYCVVIYVWAYADTVEIGDLTKKSAKSMFDGRYVTFTNYQSTVKIDSQKDISFGLSRDGSLLFGKTKQPDTGSLYGYAHVGKPSNYEKKHGCLLENARVMTQKDMDGFKKENLLNQ